MMKKHSPLTVCLILTAVVMLSACKKYEEGPMLSLKSKTARVTGTWKAEKVTDGASGKDFTSIYTDDQQKWEFKDDGTLIASNKSGSVAGTWAFLDKKEKIHIVYSALAQDTVTILKLKSKEFWYKVDEGGDEFQLIPN